MNRLERLNYSVKLRHGALIAVLVIVSLVLLAIVLDPAQFGVLPVDTLFMAAGLS